MFYPRFEEMLRLSREYNLLPVRYRLLADTETPIRIFQKIRGENTFLLESVEGGSRWARYSFIGLEPFLVFAGKGTQATVTERDGTVRVLEGNPFLLLRREFARFRSPRDPQFPRFAGGAVGFFGYELLHYFEDIPLHRRHDLPVNDVQFLFCDQVIAFDHLKQEIQLIAHVHVREDDDARSLKRKYEEACAAIRRLERLIREEKEASAPGIVSFPAARAGDHDSPVRSNMTKEEFEEKVRIAKKYIAAGDIFQVVLSQRFEIETSVDPLSVYRVLRSLNPSPYLYFLQFRQETIVGASPELLVRVEGGQVETRPIAGTRRRGATEAEDRALAQDLLADEKERAEHLMLLDLGRNDIGRVAEFGTVRVAQCMAIETYSHVMHLVSHVTGRLRRDKTPFDALLSCFPAGTVSGAPKIRAMEIIAELEEEARNIYAGALGYFSFNGNMDSCITIRTILFKNGKAYVQAGAGIVADSEPAKEFEETVNKAKALLKAIHVAETSFPAGEGEKDVSTGVESVGQR
ncbi:anthranilate synthase component I [Bacillaceae bacterium]